MKSEANPEDGPWTADELAEAVNAWCDRHGIEPMEGRASDRLTSRNLHYYRSLGLITSPGRGRGRGYGEKQFLELVAIRLLQARGLPQKKIQQLLYGRDLEDLRRIRDRGISEQGDIRGRDPISSLSRTGKTPSIPDTENWNALPLDERHLLITRSGRSPGPRQVELIRRILSASPAELDQLTQRL